MQYSLIPLLLLSAIFTAHAAPADEQGEQPPVEASVGSPVDGATDSEVNGEDLTASVDNPLDQLARRIEAFEHEQALVVLKARVRKLERERHRYDPELIEPLLLMGDAHMKGARYEEALDQYDRAIHIDRVTNGLHSPSQVDAIYREAQALIALGDLHKANGRYEYAYEVQKRRFGEESLELLEPTYRLAEWHMRHMNILSARSLYSSALGILSQNGRGEHPDAIRPLRALAQTYRLQKFPPFYVHSNESPEPFAGYSNDFNRNSGDVPTAASINQFPRGERALNQVIRILEADPATPSAEVAQAYLDLGDWNLLFGYPRRAEPLYAHAWALYEGSELDAAEQLGEPVLLYFPTPADPKPRKGQLPEDALEGTVSLQFTVSEYGTVRNLQTVETLPDDRMEFRVRRSMRSARFRPRMVESQLVEATEQEYTHVYRYHPDDADDATADDDDTETTEEPVDGTEAADAEASDGIDENQNATPQESGAEQNEEEDV